MFKFKVEYLNEFNIWTELHDWIRPIMDKRTLDESHDETQLFLSCAPIAEPFKPFTRFIITIEEIDDNTQAVKNIDTLYRVVIADEIKQVVFTPQTDKDGNTVDGLYNHDIRLAEASKELERYTVDNLSFTNEWRKAFQTSENGGYITSQTLGENWYNAVPRWLPIQWQESGGNVRWVFPNMFSGYNSQDAYSYGSSTPTSPPLSRPVIGNTMIARSMINNNTADDFIFETPINTSYLKNTTLTIPNVTMSPISSIKLGGYSSNLLLFWKTLEDYYADFGYRVNAITLRNPNGDIEQLNVGDVASFNILGFYRLRFNVTRTVRIHKWSKTTNNNKTYNEYTDWFDGVTSTIEFEINCVESGSQIDKLSVYDILNKLIQVTPTRFANKNTTKYRLYDTIFDRYSSVEAPEMIFTNKNLWEALKALGGVINAIPYLHITDRNNWDIIDVFPLSSEEPVSDNVETEYCNSESYYDSENYTASFDMSVDNMINPVDTNEGFINSEGYYISKTPRSEEVEISLTSINIETTYPIYKIDKVIYVDYDSALAPYGTSYDITQFINEKSLYNTLVSNNVNAGKQLSLYYTQGKPNIDGLQFKVSKDKYSDAENKIAIKRILQQALLDNGVPGSIANTYFDDYKKILEAKFIVRYVPYLNARIKLYKTNAPKLNIDTSMFQNQSANVLDARALGRRNVAILGRIGNLGYTDSIKVYSLDRIPLKGQRAKDGYFVSDVTVEYDQNHLLCSVQYTKDYQKINDFIGIQNLQRFFEVSEKQSIHRYVNTNMFYIFYGNQTPYAEIDKDKGLNQASGYPQVNYLASLFVDQGYNRKINASILTAYSEDDAGQDYVCSKVYLNSNALAIGNSICIITDYQDNYGDGYQSKPYTDGNTQAYMNKSVPYSDPKGKIKSLDVQNVTDSNIVYPSNATLDDNISAFGEALPAITQLDSDNKPITGTEFYTIADTYQNDNKPTFSNVGCRQKINLQKDSREIIHINQQHHFLTADDSIVVGSAMTESCRFIQENTMKCRLVFLKNKIDAYEFTIKDSDIIGITLPSQEELKPTTQALIDLGTEITATNLATILSTTNNTDALYILPNINYGGAVIGLNQDAEAWAIITDENKLIIGKNESLKATSGVDYDSATQINLSITSEY